MRGSPSSLALSVIWTVLASAFIGVGLVRDFAPLRYLAMALFGLTVLKVFLVDLSSLGGIYRILGFIGVGLVLLAVSFLYQRARRKPLPQSRRAEQPQRHRALKGDLPQRHKGHRDPLGCPYKPLCSLCLCGQVFSVAPWLITTARARGFRESTSTAPPRRETRGW